MYNKYIYFLTVYKTMPEVKNNKFELKIFKKKNKNDKNFVKSPENNQKNSNGPVNRVKIAAPYAYVEELVVNSPSERNWRGIFIALLVIAAVLGLIVFSIVLVSPPEECPRAKGIKPSLEDIFIKLPPPAKFNGTWISDTEFIFKDFYGGISLYTADNLTTSIIMTNITLRQYEVVDFKVSNDLKFVLLISDIVKVYKYTTLAKYHIYEILTRIRKPLSPKELDENAPFLQYAVWSPDGTAIAFVYDNDIYYKPKVEKDLVCRITNTGQPNVIFNGVPDWLYENEILKTSHTLWFSQDNYYLLYITFNNTKIGEYKYAWYNSQTSETIYPQVRSFRYPRVETTNPEVTVWIVNLTMPKFLFPFELKPTNSVDLNSYVTSANFHGENNVDIIWLNRPQNKFVIVTCRNQNNYNCTNFHVEKEHEHIGWTEPVFHPVFNENGTKSLVRLPVKDGDNGHYMHACVIYNGKVRPLTHGSFEIIRILAWDEENSFILHPYHVVLHQALTEMDFDMKTNYCHWLLGMVNENPKFLFTILWADEATFNSDGGVNCDNMHCWSAEDPHWMLEVQHQGRWSVNVWCGIIIGPYFLYEALMGAVFLELLRNTLPILLEDANLELRRSMFLQLDGCPFCN